MSAIKQKLLNLPIRNKITLIVFCTAGLLIGLMAIAITAEKYFEYRHSLVEDMTTLAEIIGTNSTAALSFRDRVTANEILAALQAEADVIAACLLDDRGQLFATYERGQHAKTPLFRDELEALVQVTTGNQEVRFQSGVLDLSRSIRLNGKRIGYIVIRTDLETLHQSIQRFVLTLIAFSLVLFAIAHLICTRLNHHIVGPITDLVDSMQSVSADQNYSVRVPVRSTDEIGSLVDGFNAMLTKIQERDEEIGRHREHLEDLVEQRTWDLRQSNENLSKEIEERKSVQSQLVHAQKMEAIGRLAGGVAHDLNNILSGVVSYPELLLMNMTPDDQLYNPLNTIMASGKKAAAIVQDLLTLARRGVKVEESVDLVELVNDYLSSPEYARLMSFHPLITVDMTADDNMMNVIGSPMHLSKMIMNLISNAAEAMPDGGRVAICVTGLSYMNPLPGFPKWRKGPYVCLTVSDTGVGIAEADIHRIFEPFYTKKVMGRSGTGLGMAVIWGTIEDHEGHINVHSTEGLGTTFEIYLPAREKTAVRQVADIVQQPIMGEGQSILVVDDSEDQRALAREILLHLGYCVEVAASGEAAVELLKTRTFDLVILDMLMPPGMDGLDTYREIIRLRPGLKTIIASGFSESRRVREARELGVSAYVRKPYTVTQISDSIRSALFAPPAQQRNEG